MVANCPIKINGISTGRAPIQVKMIQALTISQNIN
jgi:hypothetical protein